MFKTRYWVSIIKAKIQTCRRDFKQETHRFISTNLTSVIEDSISDSLLVLLDCSGESRNLQTTFIAIFCSQSQLNEHYTRSYITVHKINQHTQLGPPKGIVPGLTPAATEGEGWTWRTTNDESGEDDESFRLSRAHLRASILTSLPSTATTTQVKLRETSMAFFSSNSISVLWFN